MPAGRPPKPTRLKMLTGTLEPGRTNHQEPTPDVSKGRPPYWLTGKRRWAWKRLAPLLTSTNVLTVSDEDALALLSDAYGEYLELRATLQDQGYTYTSKTENGEIVRARPEVQMMAEAFRRLERLMVQFGLTPSSRARIKASPTEEVDPFDEFLKGTG